MLEIFQTKEFTRRDGVNIIILFNQDYDNIKQTLHNTIMNVIRLNVMDTLTNLGLIDTISTKVLPLTHDGEVTIKYHKIYDFLVYIYDTDISDYIKNEGKDETFEIIGKEGCIQADAIQAVAKRCNIILDKYAEDMERNPLFKDYVDCTLLSKLNLLQSIPIDYCQVDLYSPEQINRLNNIKHNLCL
jgi:hypothetical protein